MLWVYAAGYLMLRSWSRLSSMFLRKWASKINGDTEMYLMRMKPTSPIRMYSCLMSFTPNLKRRFTGIILQSCDFFKNGLSGVSVYNAMIVGHKRSQYFNSNIDAGKMQNTILN